MKLGNLLANIAETEGNTREQLKAEALEKIKGHTEEVLLMKCFEAACAGSKYIDFGRKVLPPECLKDEGFELRNNGCSYEYYFE